MGTPGAYASIFELKRGDTHFILKRQMLRKKQFSRDYQEILCMNLLQTLMKHNCSPNFVLLHQAFLTQLYNVPRPLCSERLRNHPIPDTTREEVLFLYSLQERCAMTLEQYLTWMAHEKTRVPDSVILSMFLQSLSAILSMQWYIPDGGMSHNDLYFRNIFLDVVHENVVFVYHIQNSVYFCRSHGWMLKFGDFGWSTVRAWQSNVHKMGIGKKRIRGKQYKDWDHVLEYENIDVLRRDMLTIAISWIKYEGLGILSPRISTYLRDFVDELRNLDKVTRSRKRVILTKHTLANFVEQKLHSKSLWHYRLPPFSDASYPRSECTHTWKNSDTACKRIERAQKIYDRQFLLFAVAPISPITSYQLFHYYPTDSPRKSEEIQEEIASQVRLLDQNLRSLTNTVAQFPLPSTADLGACELSRPFFV